MRPYKKGYGKARKSRQIRKLRINRSLYDADAWITVNIRAPLSITTVAAPVYTGYIQMRTDLGTSTLHDFSWLDQPEYQFYFGLYQFCEVRGMKMTVNAGAFKGTTAGILNRITMYAGPSADVPTGVTIANEQRLQGLPTSKAVGINGGAVSLYHNCYKVLKDAGLITSVQRNQAFPAEYGQVVYCYA